MSTEIFWLYEVVVKPGQLDTLRTLMAELVESTHDEPGALPASHADLSDR